MKKLLIIGIAASTTAAALGVGAGIAFSANTIESSVRLGYGPGGIAYSLVRIDGHEYLTSACTRAVSTIHSESCPCRNADAVRYKKTVVDGKTWLVPECGRGTAGIPLTE